MASEVLINVGPAETRVAFVEESRLSEVFLERTIEPGGNARAGRHGHRLLGNILLGRVQRVLPGMQAAFVDLGLEKAGFLAAREARCLSDLPSFMDQPCISKCVREGESVVVQVIKDPISEKGARLSANVTLAGRLVVLVPNQSGVALSRRIDDEAERARLTGILSDIMANDPRAATGAGYIVRTAALSATKDDIASDIARLGDEWRIIQARRTMAKVPATLYHDLDPVERTMRDGVDEDTTRVLIDNADAVAQARAYAMRAMPEALDKIHHFNGPGELFDLYGIEAELEAFLSPRVRLPSGGWITFETTEALTSVDVNSGSYTEATGLEQTSLKTNIEAAAEIGRQLRLRGIGGLIVIDFIHLNEPENIGQVLTVLADSVTKDRTPTQILPMSAFGLVEMTRKRVREPLSKLFTEVCDPCHGHGRVKTVVSVAAELLRRVAREAKARPGTKLAAYAAPEVVRWIEAQGDDLTQSMRRYAAAGLRFEARPQFARATFDVGADQ
ncbi:MAG: Rne/Rng family ribonuclease [Alphaproteobacteria bacterium]|nr:Rne/Rng family ribonuclease [Alphaproteobacteria bacterium]